MYMSLSVIDDDYQLALSHLGITKKINNIKGNCIICDESSTKLILTPCKHIYCLSCILGWLITIKAKKDFCCAYCRQIFNWIDCYDCYDNSNNSNDLLNHSKN